jgi:hypothetical protein
LTDNGNFVLDALFPAERMKNANLKALYDEIKLLNGVVEVGLFVGMGEAAYFGNAVGHFLLQFILYEWLIIFNLPLGRQRHSSLEGREGGADCANTFHSRGPRIVTYQITMIHSRSRISFAVLFELGMSIVNRGI